MATSSYRTNTETRLRRAILQSVHRRQNLCHCLEPLRIDRFADFDLTREGTRQFDVLDHRDVVLHRAPATRLDPVPAGYPSAFNAQSRLTGILLCRIRNRLR